MGLEIVETLYEPELLSFKVIGNMDIMGEKGPEYSMQAIRTDYLTSEDGNEYFSALL